MTSFTRAPARTSESIIRENIVFLKHYLAQMTEDNWRDNREHCDRLVREMEEHCAREL